MDPEQSINNGIISVKTINAIMQTRVIIISFYIDLYHQSYIVFFAVTSHTPLPNIPSIQHAERI